MSAIITNLGILSSTSITPSDSVDVAKPHNEGILVDTAGAVSFEYADGTTDTITFPTDGSTLRINFLKVRATGTTAIGIHGLRLNP